jgi:hypothetical protein
MLNVIANRCEAKSGYHALSIPAVESVTRKNFLIVQIKDAGNGMNLQHCSQLIIMLFILFHVFGVMLSSLNPSQTLDKAASAIMRRNATATHACHTFDRASQPLQKF